MPYGTPTDPVPGTVITVAYQVANVLDPIRWLRLMTGGSDPPGTNYALLSASVSGTYWGKIPGDAIADGAISTAKILNDNVTGPKLAAGAALGNLGYTPVNAATPLHVTFSELRAANMNGFFEISPSLDGPSGVSSTWYAINIGETNQPTNYCAQLAVNISDANALYLRVIAAGTVGPWRRIWHDGNTDLQVATAKLADLAVTTPKLADLAVTNAKIANATISGDAKLVPGSVTGSSGPSAIGANVLHANRLQDGTMIAGEINRLIPAGQIAADRLAVGVAVPSGLIAGFRTAAAIAPGWNRCDGSGGRPNLNGRLLVGATVAGTPIGGVDWPENAASGTSWTLQSVTGLPSSGPVQGGGTSTANPGDHTHAVAWTIPTFSVVWAIRT